MSFFAFPLLGSAASSVASWFSGSGSAEASQYTDMGDRVMALYRGGLIDEALTTELMGSTYTNPMFRNAVHEHYLTQGYDGGMLHSARLLGERDDYYTPSRMNSWLARANTGAYIGNGGGMDGFVPYYNEHIQPGLVSGASFFPAMGGGIMPGVNFGDGAGDILSFLGGMGHRGYPRGDNLGGLIQDCGFGGGHSDRGHGLGGLANLGGLGNIGRLFS